MPLNPICPPQTTGLLAPRGNAIGLNGAFPQFAVRVCVPSVRRCLILRRYERGGSFFVRAFLMLATSLSRFSTPRDIFLAA